MNNSFARQAVKKMLSVLLGAAILAACFFPAFSAYADDGVIGVWEIQIFYEDGTLVPDTDDDGNDFIEYMTEGEKKQFIYNLVDCTVPDNGWVEWSSDTPTVCDVTEDGLVRAFDSSKGAAVRLWLDNEVASIPLVGSVLYSALESVFFNDYVDLDTMDTDEIVAILETLFSSDSSYSSYSDSLIESLEEYLNKINTTITVTVYDSDGTALASDSFAVCVQKSEEWYADLIPNGTHITNKSSLPTTVAVDSTVQLTAVTTPVRLNMGVVYTVKNSSILTTGKTVATVNDSGLVTFKNTGTVTIVVSPDTEGFIENILKYVNYLYTLENTGTIDSDTIAGVLIDYMGLDINRTVLAGIIDACFVVYDVATDSADPVQITATAVEIIANLIYYSTTNDSITFTVIEGVPLTDFNISGATSVQEGSQIQLEITDTEPDAADTSDITWSSSDESIAYVDPETGIVTGRDAGGSLGSLSSQTVEITATSAANNVSKTVTITVTGKTGKYLSDVGITAENENPNIGDSQTLSANIYPSRVSTSSNLYIYWGVVTSGSDEDDYEYVWATDDAEEEGEDGSTVTVSGAATDGIGSITTDGVYTALAGGTCTIACRAVTGYNLTSSNFYTISEAIATIDIENGQPVNSISLEATGLVSSTALTSSLSLSSQDVEIEGVTHHYATVTIPVGIAYYSNGCTVSATINPDDATNKNLVWYLDGAGADNFYLTNQDDEAGTVEVRMSAGAETAGSVNVYCMSEDGEVKSDILTVTVTRNSATGNTIDGGDTSLTIYTTLDMTHTMTFSGSWTGTAYACYGANWYSSDEDVLSVQDVDDDGNAIIYGEDVGVATLYCVSTDGYILDSVQVTVYPDKSVLQSIVDLCEKTVIVRTSTNTTDYQTYMRYLDYAYYLLEDVSLPSQATVDTWAQNLLYIFYKLGGFISLSGIYVLDEDGNVAGDYISVDVTTTSYKKTSYDLGYRLNPQNCMYSSLKWTSSSSDVTVTSAGVCSPASNSACYSVISVTAVDYMGNEYTDSVTIAFVKTAATGVSVSPDSITGGKVGETQTLSATVSPTGTLGIGAASVSDVVWSSSDESIATVDSSGVVTFVAGGDCVITATTVDGGYTADCAVNVVTNYDELQVLVNTYVTLALEETNYYPDTWQAFQSALTDAQTMIDEAASSQAEVDEMIETLTAAYEGLTKYTYITKVELYLDGDVASDFYQYDLSLLSEGVSYTNAELDLNVRLYPNNASYDYVEWESSTDDITVSSSGVCSPSSNSYCYGMITCTVYDHFGNSYSDEVWVSFAYRPVTAITLTDTSITGEEGDTYTLEYQISPGYSIGSYYWCTANIQDVYWESDDESVATVDSSGVVTFVGTGSTTVRVVTYDGGYSAECTVSTGGDRSSLSAAIAEYESIDYQDYTYEYGTAFKEAYDAAVAALTDSSLTQSEIDEITAALVAAAQALSGNEFVEATIELDYETQYHTLGVTWTSKTTGDVDDSATTYTLTQSSSVYNSRVILTAALSQGSEDNYESLEWSVDSASSYAEYSIDGTSITVNSTAASRSAELTLTATATDCYGRTVSRTIRVVITSTAVTGVSLDKTSVEQNVTDGSFTLTATIEPSNASVTDVTWTSSDESVATVDSSGVVTPVDTGSCTITVETADGGYTAECALTLNTDFTSLAAAYNEYSAFVDEIEEEHIYTSASITVLQQALSDTAALLGETNVKQSEVDSMYETLVAAYAGLEYAVAITGVDITTSDSSVTEVNSGYLRYSSSISLNGKSFQLDTTLYPEGVTYTDVQWTSSNDDITVEDGLVTSNSASASWAVITVTYTDETGAEFSESVYVSFTRSTSGVVTGVTLSETEISGTVGSTYTLSATLSKSSTLTSAQITDVIYESADEAVATVDSSGVITFVSVGETTVTVTTADGGYSASTAVSVTSGESAAAASLASSLSSVLTTASAASTASLDEETQSTVSSAASLAVSSTVSSTASAKSSSASAASTTITAAATSSVSSAHTHTWGSAKFTTKATTEQNG
ncbi:MAG: Ig-like domain-containing protein, partial [Clostridiales bacterium]|nr:Ig-like domain-containing protein [Clostridiales bacterium]